jgi:membrane protein
VFGRQAAQGQLVEQLQQLVGAQGGEALQTMIAHSGQSGSSIPAMIVGVLMLFIGASGVFAELQDSLNTIWGVTPKPGRGLWGIIQDRFLSLAMVLGTGFLLLVTLVISTALAALTRFVGIGAFATAVLFTLGQGLIGLYLGHASVGSAYGAAGSLVVFAVWVYYSAQILYLGAEFTKVYANHFGSRIRPAENAVPVTAEARAEQGLVRQQTAATARRSGFPA